MKKVIHQLGVAGDIETIRGRGGGIRLARRPGTINVGAVVRRTEDLALVTCLEGGACRISPACMLQTALKEALAAFLAVLDRYTMRRSRLVTSARPPFGSMMDVTAWRREQRLRLYAARKAMTAEQRHNAARKIAGGLDDHIAYHKPVLVGLYWPIKYEPNLLSWARTQAQTFRFCLPVVVSRGQPLEYWLWMPGDQMQSGVWDIQIPARREVVTPDLMIAPLLGFDRACYRLGNGGGYFDRTLAVRRDRPFVVGVGYAESQLETIHPQPHDIAMNLILTERS